MVRRLLRTGIVLACLAVFGAIAGPASASVGVSPRIVGGGDTTLAEHPWQVSIFYGPSDPICGGVILDPWHVLTAAHCLLDGRNLEPVSAINVLAGVTDLRPPALPDEQFIGAARLRVMPSYGTPLPDSHDAGIITLSRPLVFGTDVQKAKVTTGPAAPALSAGDPLEVTGWGQTETAKVSDVLQKTSVDLVDDATCPGQFVDSAYAGDFDATTMLCAITPGQDSCFGDSGGPLTTTPTLAQPDRILVGLVSWGPSTCGGADGPGVYAELAEPQLNAFARGPHIVGIDGPQRAAPGTQVNLVAVVGDNDTPDSGLHFTWDLDGDGEYDDADTGSSDSVSTTLPATDGNLTVGVRVADDLTSDTARGTISVVTPTPPVNTNPTVPPAPSEPAPKPDVTGPKVVVRSITRAGTRAAVRLGCPGDSACHGVITLRSTRKVKTRSGRRTIAVGRAEFRLGWQEAIVRVRLSGAARRLLRSRSLPVTATIVAFDAAGNSTRKVARSRLAGR